MVAERAHIPALIVVNKVDLIGLEAAKELFGLYEDIGYEVIYASANTGEGTEICANALPVRLAPWRAQVASARAA